MRLRTLVVLLLLSVAPLASATTVLRAEMDDLARTSQWIVRADVAGVTTVDRRAWGEGIFTDVELEIGRVYKGADVPQRYVLRMIGGVGADGMQLRIPGMPTFQAGDDVILFLEAVGPRWGQAVGHIPTGLGQGVWRVLRTPSGDEWARQATGHVHLMQRVEGRLTPVDPASQMDTRHVDDLVDAIYLALEAPASEEVAK